MVAWLTKNFGGEIPKLDARLLTDNAAEAAVNTDLLTGKLSGLSVPQIAHDFSALVPRPQRAYRFPGPAPGQPDVWVPLPSPYSSVVRSPLANDTLHRIYWTNPPDSILPGGWWNTYDRLVAGLPNYNMGFTAPSPAFTPSATAMGGDVPRSRSTGVTVEQRGTGAVPGALLGVVGGLLNQAGVVTTFKIANTVVTNVYLVAGGTGGVDGTIQFTGTTGTGVFFTAFGLVVGGIMRAITSLDNGGRYNTNPTNLANEPCYAGGGLTGLVISMTMGASSFNNLTSADYITPPPNPATVTPDASNGVDPITVKVQYVPAGIPPLDRSYLFTYIDQYGIESSPSNPSVVVSGASDALWTITLDTLPPSSPAGKNYPPVVSMWLYRTVTGKSSGAQFYRVANFVYGVNPPPAAYSDTSLDTNVVQQPALVSTGWAPPLDNLDGLLAMAGGMLVGFTENTIHFCEPNRPHAWPAGYDQSVRYQVVGLGLWQQTLMVLTKGYPFSGSGNMPANFTFSQVQTPEPCIARGSIVTDLLGVYYASPNGLVMLSYYGMQNQTLAILTRDIWLTEYAARNIIACRHRAQYLAINGTGDGFIIDYTEARLGVCHLNTFLGVTALWNDVYSGDATIMANGKVYIYDDPLAPPLRFRWRSKKFFLNSPASLGAFQVDVDPAILTALPSAVPMLDNGDPSLRLPPGVVLLFRIYANDTLIYEGPLVDETTIGRLPGGFKTFQWQFELVGDVPVYQVQLATTMIELKKV